MSAAHPIHAELAQNFAKVQRTYRAAYQAIKASGKQEKYAERGDWLRWVLTAGRICKIEAFAEVQDVFTDYWYWRLLGHILWTSENHSVYRDLYLSLMRSPRPERHAFMRPEQLRAWRRLPEKVNIFRGHGPLNRDGFWYSLTLPVAMEVAASYGCRGRVSHERVPRADLFYLGGDKDSVIYIRGLGDIHK